MCNWMDFLGPVAYIIILVAEDMDFQRGAWSHLTITCASFKLNTILQKDM